MNETEHAACRAIEAVIKDKEIPLKRRREWIKLLQEIANLPPSPSRGRPKTIDKPKIVELLKNPEGLPKKELFAMIAEQCGCSAVYVEKIHQGKR